MWPCHKYDVNYMTMPPAVYRDMQYDNDGVCHDKRSGGKLHGNISRNGYGNAIIGRYGGCFEEDIGMFMCDRPYHITGVGCTGEVAPTLEVRKGNARYRRG